MGGVVTNAIRLLFEKNLLRQKNNNYALNSTEKSWQNLSKENEKLINPKKMISHAWNSILSNQIFLVHITFIIRARRLFVFISRGFPKDFYRVTWKLQAIRWSARNFSLVCSIDPYFEFQAVKVLAEGNCKTLKMRRSNWKTGTVGQQNTFQSVLGMASWYQKSLIIETELSIFLSGKKQDWSIFKGCSSGKLRHVQ